MVPAPLGAAFTFAALALTPVLGSPFACRMDLTLVSFTRRPRLAFTRFTCAPILCVLLARLVALTGLVVLTGFMTLPSLVLLCLSRRHIVVSPAALLAVVPARWAPVVIVVGDIAHMRTLVVAPTIVIAVVSAPVIGKGAAGQQRNC